MKQRERSFNLLRRLGRASPTHCNQKSTNSTFLKPSKPPLNASVPPCIPFITSYTPEGRHSLTRRTPYAASNYHVHRHSKNNTSAIGIDDLFAEPASSMHEHANKAHAQGETSRGKEVVGKKDLAGGSGSSGINTIEDAWKIVVAKSSQQQVDERAEDFISKFHEDMRLQKERSLLEFQERLARSA
ncbi:hypothetical protein SESBI_30724 [Sesbania bispinosa]|nr:hypothetical protein SESBI_30724 [Sesbania bispinosa]